MSLAHPYRTVTALGIAQTLGWASSYYLPAILAQPMARDLGMTVPGVFGMFSLAMLATAALGPAAGRTIDRLGGRPVLMLSNLVFAGGLALLGLAEGLVVLMLGWLVIGVGMSIGLYEAAFATLVRLQGQGARSSITGITLFAGFASTVGWPLSAWLEQQWDWRTACFAWAALHLLLGLPLNAWLPRVPGAAPAAQGTEPPPVIPIEENAPDVLEPSQARRITILLSFVFAATWFISTAMASHLPRLLQMGGATLAGAVAIAALVGPAQVAGRLLEFGLLRRIHPLLSARLAGLAHPVGAVAFVVFGPAFATLFAVLHGAGNGIMTIAKGTLPLVIFGARGYGLRQGWLMVPTRFAQAGSPWLFGLCLDRYGVQALWFTAGLGALALLALMALPSQPQAGAGPRVA